MHSKTIAASHPGPFVDINSVREIPSRLETMAFLSKAFLFRARRALLDPNGKRPRKFPKAPIDETVAIIAEAASFLYSGDRGAGIALQTGKVENLRKVARYLDGIIIPAGEVFSFWAHVPRPTRARGFVKGRELREGCLIPSTGGGLCQVSNALYQAALDARFEIIERHAHSRILPGSSAERNRDATIFWNYVDLRFKPAVECQLEVKLTRNQLIVRLRSSGKTHRPAPAGADLRTAPANTTMSKSPAALESCDTCHATKCFRHISPATRSPGEITAWLVDAWWPEHDTYLRKTHKAGDWLFTPLNGARLGINAYRWSSADFTRVIQAPLQTFTRSIRSRRLTAQGAARQRALLAMDETLAHSYARKIPCHATHLIISQNLLPYLWREGHLGGRTFDVLITRLPMAGLHHTLDTAAAHWPESRTLADFRAPRELIEAETRALSAARQWITPHSAIAAHAGPRAKKLDWATNHAARETITRVQNTILFPASTLARKGAYEVRHAARELGLKVLLGGPILESPTFWNGIDTAPFDLTTGCIPRDILAVVLPAWVENQPRHLLAAARAGLPVIATENCGLAGISNITEIPAGGTGELTSVLARVFPAAAIAA